MNSWRRAHLLCGLAALVLFLGTGQYMALVHNRLHGLADGPRLLYRSNHIYLLWAAVANLVLGCYLHGSTTTWRRNGQRLGSAAWLATIPLLLLAFATEAPRGNLQRPYSRPAAVLALVGGLLHLASAARAPQVDLLPGKTA